MQMHDGMLVALGTLCINCGCNVIVVGVSKLFLLVSTDICFFFFFWDLLWTLLAFVGFWIELMFSSTLVNVTLKVR
jgi:hypothetical protein